VDFPIDGNALFESDSKITSAIDIRDCFDEMIALRGHKAFLRKANTAQKSAVDSPVGEHSMDDSQALQNGFPYEDIKIKTLDRLLSDRGLQTDEMLDDLGYVGVHLRVYYIRYDLFPKSLDSVVEVSLDECGEYALPYNIESIWDVQGEPKEYRDQKGGRIEYYICFCRKRQLGK
jgi:hypothetical protein